MLCTGFHTLSYPGRFSAGTGIRSIGSRHRFSGRRRYHTDILHGSFRLFGDLAAYRFQPQKSLSCTRSKRRGKCISAKRSIGRLGICSRITAFCLWHQRQHLAGCRYWTAAGNTQFSGGEPLPAESFHRTNFLGTAYPAGCRPEGTTSRSYAKYFYCLHAAASGTHLSANTAGTGCRRAAFRLSDLPLSPMQRGKQWRNLNCICRWAFPI